jgi:hypothetical protein
MGSLARVAAKSPVAATVPVGVWFGAISQLARSCAFGSTANRSRHRCDIAQTIQTRYRCSLFESPERSPADSIKAKPYRNAVANHLQSGGDCGLWSRYAKRSAGLFKVGGTRRLLGQSPLPETWRQPKPRTPPLHHPTTPSPHHSTTPSSHKPPPPRAQSPRAPDQSPHCSHRAAA